MSAPFSIGPGITFGSGITIGTAGVGLGGSINFDPTFGQEYSTNSNALYLPSPSDMSVEFWLNPSSVNPNSFTYGVFFYQIASNATGISILLDPSGLLTVTPPVGASMSYTIPFDTWTYVCTGIFGGDGRLTVNGVNVGNSGSASTDWTSNLHVGYAPGADILFNGQITNVRICTSDVNGIGGGGNCSVPTSPLTAVATTILLLNATNAGSVLTDTSGYNGVNIGVPPPTWSSASPY